MQHVGQHVPLQLSRRHTYQVALLALGVARSRRKGEKSLLLVMDPSPCIAPVVLLRVQRGDHDDLESLERDMNEESGWKLVRSCRAR